MEYVLLLQTVIENINLNPNEVGHCHGTVLVSESERFRECKRVADLCLFLMILFFSMFDIFVSISLGFYYFLMFLI